MSLERVTARTADGPMSVHVAVPDTGDRRAAVVVVQEAFGVNAHVQGVCARFAAEGYVALAPEIFHRQGEGVEVPYSDVPRAMQELGRLSNATLEQDLAAAFDVARARDDVDRDRVGLVGFCVGGFAAFLGACRLDPAATVAFYGGGIVRPRPNMRLEPLLPEAADIRAPILCLFGADDTGIPPSDVEAIRAGLDKLDVAHEVIVYPGAPHAFFNELRPSYRPEAATAAWHRTVRWLRTHVA